MADRRVLASSPLPVCAEHVKMMVSELGNYGTVKVEEVAVITMKRTNYNRLPSADVAIVGAGPIGLELTAALKRAGVDYLHFEAKQK